MTSTVLSSVKIVRAVISPFVSVPVLSEQMTVVAPKVSAEVSLLIIAFRFASSRAPRANEIVTTAGSPSGTADTAKATAVMKFSISVPGLAGSKTSRIKIAKHAMMIIIPSFFAKLSSLSFSGVSSSSTACTISAIFPNSVFMPVDVTTAFPRPYVT